MKDLPKGNNPMEWRAPLMKQSFQCREHQYIEKASNILSHGRGAYTNVIKGGNCLVTGYQKELYKLDNRVLAW